MRVNVYAEEMTDRVEIVTKEIDGTKFTGVRIYLYLPATDANGRNVKGPFIHRDGHATGGNERGPVDDDSAAVTFWGKRDLRPVLLQAVDLLDAYYDRPMKKGEVTG